jgi:transcription elongation factor Elf1
MDNLINCSRCGSDACYVEEVNQDIKTYFCYGCGFQTNSVMKEGGDFYEEQIKFYLNFIKIYFEDEEGKIWMPSSTNIPQQGMIFANGPSKTDWGWAAVKAVPVAEEEKEKYPIPKKRMNFMNGEWI